MVELTERIRAKFPAAVQEVVEYAGETTLVVGPARLKGLMRHLRDSEGFNFLADVSCAHWPEMGRIDVVYQVRNMSTRLQFRVRVPLPEEDPEVESVSEVWRTANWLEREVYDLMGVRFLGHPDLKRIMLPEDFEGHPLRKEYPMQGDDAWRNYLAPEESE
jgi:NADH-quinone oxidoreductase subunit C